MQLYTGLCKKEYGQHADVHACDLHGARRAGDSLRDMMRLGQSQPWQEALRVAIGEDELSAQPLLAYYEPLRRWLGQEVDRLKIPLGW